MVRTLQSWFWLIPLESDRTSIGVVLEAADFKSSGLSAEEFFERAIAEQPLVRDRIGDWPSGFRRFTPRPTFPIGAKAHRRSLVARRRCRRLHRSGFQQRRFSRRARRRTSAPMFCTKCSITQNAPGVFSALRAAGQPRDGCLSAFRELVVLRQGIHRSFPNADRAFPNSTGSECRARR